MRRTLKNLCNHALVRHRFFQNIGTISIFAVFGTFISTFYIAFFLEVNTITCISPINYALSDKNWEHTNLTRNVKLPYLSTCQNITIASQRTPWYRTTLSAPAHINQRFHFLRTTAGGRVARFFTRARRCHHRRVLALRSPHLRRRPR